MVKVKIQEQLTPLGAQLGILHYLVEILRALPVEYEFRSLTPGFPQDSAFGPGTFDSPGPGYWDYEISYDVYGYEEGQHDQVWDQFFNLFKTWDWLDTTTTYKAIDKGGDADWITKPRYMACHSKDGYAFGVNLNGLGAVTITAGSAPFPRPKDGKKSDAIMPFCVTRNGPLPFTAIQHEYDFPYTEPENMPPIVGVTIGV